MEIAWAGSMAPVRSLILGRWNFVAMANRTTDAGGANPPRFHGLPGKRRHARWPPVAGTILLVAYVIVAYRFLHEQPMFLRLVLALGFIALAVTTYLLATRSTDLSEELALRLKEAEPAEFARQIRAIRARQHRKVRIPGLGEVPLRPVGAICVLVVSAIWWLTPWAPVVLKPPVLGDLTIPLGEDLVAAMLALPDDHVAVVQPPILPPHLGKNAKLIRDDASPYPLALRAMVQADFDNARIQLARALDVHDGDETQVRVTCAQVEMYAARFPEAIARYESVLKLKADQPMLWCQSAAARIQAGQFDRAEQDLKKAADVCREKPGESDRALPACQHLRSLLAVFRCKDFDEAVKRIEECRQTCKKAMGEQRSLMAAGDNNQAALYLLQANYSGAQELFGSAQTTWSEALGPQDPHVAAVEGNLAALSFAQGQYAKAREWLGPADSIPQELLPGDHPARIARLTLRAMIERAEGHYDRAQAAAEEALAIAEKGLDIDHPWSAAVADDLALIYADRARVAKAYRYGFRAVSLAKRLWGPEHPFLAQELSGLAAICTLQESYPEADTLCREAETVAQRAYGKKHLSVAAALATRGRLEIAKDSAGRAKKPLGRACDLYEAVFPKGHPDLARTLGDLASLDNTTATYQEGIDTYQRALDMAGSFFGAEHPEIARLLCGMAVLRSRQEKYADAKDLLDRALAIQRKMLPASHPDLAATLEAYAAVLAKMAPDDPEAARKHAEAQGILTKHREEDRADAQGS